MLFQSILNMKRTAESTICAFTEHRLPFIWNINTQYQENCNTKSTIKSKHIWTSKKKSGNSQVLLSFLLSCYRFYCRFFTWSSYRVNLYPNSTSLVCTLVVEGPASHVKTWRFAPPKTAVGTLYILLLSSTLLIKIQSIKNILSLIP